MSEPTSSGSPLPLKEEHMFDLRASGLSDDTLRHTGYRSATADETRKILGFSVGPGLVIPYTLPEGEAPFFRVKPDTPPVLDGKPAKYLTPKGAGNRLFVPARLSGAILQDAEKPLLITEGEKKADKASQEGFPTLSVPGVWSWRHKNEQGQSEPIPDLDRINWKGRNVVIAYDSDATKNAEVHRAEEALAGELVKRGASVRVARIPEGPEGEKQGLDDLLVNTARNSLLQVLKLAKPWGMDTLGLLNTDQVLEAETDRADWLIQGLLPIGTLCLLVGPPKRGKSLMTLNMGLAVTLGKRFLGMDTKQVPVLIASWEDTPGLISGRLKKMLPAMTGPAGTPAGKVEASFPKTLHFAFPSTTLPGSFEQVTNAIRAHNARLVIIDPWVYASGIEDENDNSKVAKITQQLKSLTEKEGVTVLIVHHPRKFGGSGGMEVRGAGALFGAVDVLLSLKVEGVPTENIEEECDDPTAVSSVGELQVTTKFGGRVNLNVGLYAKHLNWQAVDEAMVSQNEDFKESLLQRLTEGECDAQKLCAHTGAQRKKVDAAMNELLREGRVQVREEGKSHKRLWKVAPPMTTESGGGN